MKKVVGSYKKRRGERLQSNNCRFEGIAVDIIWDILSRLPTKTCLNCKLVCKTWYAVITNPDFGDQRRTHGRYLSVFLQGRFNGWNKESLLLELDKFSSKFHDEKGNNLLVPDDAKVRFKPELRYPNSKLKLVNECKGLLCFKTEARWSCFVICNPLTTQQVTVKQPYKAGYRVVSCGLGYSPASHRYKILRILMPTSSKHKNNYCVAEVHTLGDTQQQQGWRCLNGRAPVIAYQQSNAFLNGSLHGCCYSSKRIWSFNFDTEQFSLVPLSDEIRNIGVIHGVTLFESSLCCNTSHQLNNGFVMSQIWVMKEYGRKDSWVKLYSAGAFFDRSPLPLFGPLDNGDVVVSFAGANPEYEYVFAVFKNEPRGYLPLSVRGKPPSLVATCNTNFSKLPAMTITKHEHLRGHDQISDSH